VTLPTVYAFNPATNAWIGKVGTLSAASAGMSDDGNISDIAFDTNGAMFFTADTTSNGHSLYRINGPMPSVAGSATLVPVPMTPNLLSNSGIIGSLAFGSNGNLYLGQLDLPQIMEFNPRAGNGVPVTQSIGTFIPGVLADLASCAAVSVDSVEMNSAGRVD